MDTINIGLFNQQKKTLTIMTEKKYKCEDCYSSVKLKDKGKRVFEYCLECKCWRMFYRVDRNSFW